MASIAPKTRAKVSVPKAKIKYMAKNSSYTYEELIILIKAILEDVLSDTITELDIWIDSKVPKRTGQLRHMLKQWIKGSTIHKGILRMVLGTNLPYAEDVNKMTTSQVRHHGQVGYVYYPNLFKIRGRVILNDPRAVGSFFDKLIEFTKERLDINLIKAKNKHLGSAVKINRSIRTGIEVT
jgi:hypothetical protein